MIQQPNPSSWAKVLFGKQLQQPPQLVEVKKEERSPLKIVAGLGLHFAKGDNKHNIGVASLVVCSFPSMEVLYEKTQQVQLTEPYIPGFLSFREVPHLAALINELKEAKPELVPQFILLDSKGQLNNKHLSHASHLGILVDIPTVGTAKKLLNTDGLSEAHVRKLANDHLTNAGEAIELTGVSGAVLGAVRFHLRNPSP